jgi:predicted XRE-type DNA-binding protein
MELPSGAQSSIAQQLGVSRQFVSLVLKGQRQHEGISALAAELAAAYAQKVRVAQFRHYINSLSDEALTRYFA